MAHSNIGFWHLLTPKSITAPTTNEQAPSFTVQVLTKAVVKTVPSTIAPASTSKAPATSQG